MSAEKWIAKNLSLGGILKHSGNAAGKVAKLGLQGRVSASKNVLQYTDSRAKQ